VLERFVLTMGTEEFHELGSCENCRASLFLNEELFLRRNGLIAVSHRTSTGTIPRALRDVHGVEQLREEVQCSSDPSISHPTPSWPMSALG
jgi:hypothetical protein